MNEILTLVPFVDSLDFLRYKLITSNNNLNNLKNNTAIATRITAIFTTSATTSSTISTTILSKTSTTILSTTSTTASTTTTKCYKLLANCCDKPQCPIDDAFSFPQEGLIIKRSEDQERINVLKRRLVDNATEILPFTLSKGYQKNPRFFGRRIIIKRSKDVQERINKERRKSVKKTNEIFQPLFNNTRQNKAFSVPPPISEVLIKLWRRMRNKEVKGRVMKFFE
ncbi:hypothetical protein Glove_24g62 [Diversispora epigaea]|uniref:Uncharacterized protein n=1 Tax=Diversispora epigaea TaxID=1348612 RepID=A0A397JV20_9GLOM|nr:hypothetical protein Glove_24g62 [Diversispora epigaea]